MQVKRIQMIKERAVRAEAIQILAICASTTKLRPYEVAFARNDSIDLAVKAYVSAQPWSLKPPEVYAEAECMLRQGWCP